MAPSSTARRFFSEFQQKLPYFKHLSEVAG